MANGFKIEKASPIVSTLRALAEELDTEDCVSAVVIVTHPDGGLSVFHLGDGEEELADISPSEEKVS